LESCARSDSAVDEPSSLHGCNRSNAKNWSREGTRNAMLEARFKKALIPYKRLEKALKGWNAR
jgi:hypothetical protein